MTSLRDLAQKYTELGDEQICWLERLERDWPLLADLSRSDVILWVPTSEGEYLAVAHSRPAGSMTMFYRDVIGDYLREEWRGLVEEALTVNTHAVMTSPAWYEENPMRLGAHPVSMQGADGRVTGPFAVATVHTSDSGEQQASRIGVEFREAADEIFGMIGAGVFPTPGDTRGGEHGAPEPPTES